MASVVNQKKIASNIVELLKSSENKTIKLNSFWSLFDRRFPADQVSPLQFNVTKRSQILALFTECCSIFTDSNSEKYVKLCEKQLEKGPRERRSHDRKTKDDQQPSSNKQEKCGQVGRDRKKVNTCEKINEEVDMADRNRPWIHPQAPHPYHPRMHHRSMSDFQLNQYDFPSLGAHPNNSPLFPNQASNPHRFQHAQQYPQHQKIKHIPKDQLNTIAADCIDRLAEAKEYVSIERIEKMIKEQCEVESMQELGLRSPEQISCINNLIRVQAKVNAYIQAFVRVRSVATLYELSQDMKEYADDKQDFDKLKLGPLVKQPLVYEFFKFPEDDEVPEIRTSDILDHLREYMSSKNLWQARLEMEDFMQYLQAQYQVTSPYKLGLRIRSIALCAGVLKKSQRDCSHAVNQAIDAGTSSVIEDIRAAFRNLATSVLDQETGICSVRQEYTKMTAPRTVEQIFSKVTVLLDSLMYMPEHIFEREIKSKKKKREMSKHMDVIRKFKNMLVENSLCSGLFQLAVCSSWEEVHSSLQLVVGWGTKRASDAPAAAEEPSTGTARKTPPPPLGEVVGHIRVYLERCFLHGSLTLAHLARIEKKVLEEYDDFTHFADLVNMTFVEFLTSNGDVKHYLEENGGLAFGSHTGGTRAESGFVPAQNDLYDFIQQTGLNDASQANELERALCWHYRVLDVKSLGRGSVVNLQAAMAKTHLTNKQHVVFFESALCAKSRQSWQGGADRQVGVLGHQTKEAALLCLHNCPLLADMAEWSHWELVFKPELGKLKDFIRKYGGMQTSILPSGFSVTTNIVALETSPGTLLKLTADTSPEKFANAALTSDVISTCGHLLSMVTNNKGIENTPLALLGNHMKTALIKIQASGNNVPGAPGGETGAACAARFVLSCLVKLPFITAQSVATQVFLEPFGQVVGLTKSREALLEACECEEDWSQLHLLGAVLGIEMWSATFQRRLEPPTGTLLVPLSPAKPMEDEVIEILESSSESSDSSETDSDADFLSDDDDVVEITNISCETILDSVDVKAEPKQEASEDLICLSSSDEPVMIDIPGTSQSEAVPSQPEAEKDLGPQWHVVEKIRCEEFGINVTLSEDGQRLMLKQQERLGRSLARLSMDLYSKDTHFVLELIQNADDNTYAALCDDGSPLVPSVKFIVEKDTISVMNNENGFTELNVRAICDVGRSTKGKHKYGYIGQKGIGFKSVFRVTDQPEIHSSGYHIRFDVKSGPMGYILPHWVDQTPPQSDRWKTQILLPLKQEVLHTGQIQSLAARFQDVHPSLLLFLHRLRSITIVNRVSDYTVRMLRRDVGKNIIEVRHTTGTDRWLVVKKTLDASHISAQAKSGVDVESTEIALAFPLHAVSKDTSQVAPPKQPVFAFLPLRTYGFRFVIQGDFDVPSSREDVDRDSMWNQWLRSELHTLFIDALQTFKDQPNLSVVDAVCLYSQFVPMEDEILDFFRPVASLILQQLRANPCLPTQPLPWKAPQWRLPSQLVQTNDVMLKEVVTPDLLQSTLSLSYLHSAVGSRMNSSLLTTLGVQTLTTQHLIEVGRALAAQMTNANTTDREAAIVRLSKWCAAVYRSIDEFHVDKDVMAQLAALPMIPLVDGEVVRLQDSAVFFPFNAEEKYKQIEDIALLMYLETDLNTVNPKLFSDLDDVSRPQVRRLLEMLGVKKLDPVDIIKHHILPTLQGCHVQEKPRDLLVAYVMFLKEQLDIQPNLVAMDELRSFVVLATNHGIRSPKDTHIHFTPAYGNKLNLAQDLPGYDWVLLDAVYLRQCKTDASLQRWHKFFSAVGVLDHIAFNKQKLTITLDLLMQTPWSKYSPVLPKTETEFQLEDCDCAEFVSIVSKNCEPEQQHKQMRVLFEMLDSYWDSYYAKYSVTQLLGSSGQYIRDVETTFGMLLKQLPWVPALEVQYHKNAPGFCVTQRRATQLCGEEVFTQMPIIEKLLTHHVPYLHATPNPRSSFCEFLGVHTQVTVDLLQGLLVKWGLRQVAEEPAELKTSVLHVKAMYNYFYDHLSPKQLQDLFHDHPVIFVPNGSQSEERDKIVDGRLMGRAEVWWDDPTGLFTKHSTVLREHGVTTGCKPILNAIYREQEEIIRRGARIASHPTMLEYVDLLIPITHVMSVQRVLPDVLQIFSTLGSMVAELQPSLGDTPNSAAHEHQVAKVVQQLKAHAVFPTKSGRWVQLKDSPLIADDKQMEKLFMSKEGVNFVNTGERMPGGMRAMRTLPGSTMRHLPAKVQEFYRVCGVGLLSENLQSRCVTVSFQPCPSVQQYIAAVLPYIQKLLCMEYPDVYDAHISAGVKDNLAAMQFAQVGKLEVVYSLRPLPDIVVVIREVCKLKDDREFYIDRMRVTEFNEINKELAHYFSKGDDRCMKEIRSLLLELLPLVQDASPQLLRFLEQHDLEELPENEEAWEVPLPVIVRTPSPEPLPEQLWQEFDQRSESSGPTTPSSDGGGLRSWPPRSNTVPGPPYAGYGGSRPVSSMWPPPAPPSYIDRTHIPTGLRPARAGIMDNRSEQSYDGRSESSTTSHHGAGVRSGQGQTGPTSTTPGGGGDGPGQLHPQGSGPMTVGSTSGPSMQGDSQGTTGGVDVAEATSSANDQGVEVDVGMPGTPGSGTDVSESNDDQPDECFKQPEGIPMRGNKKRPRIESCSSMGSVGDRDQPVFDMPFWNTDQEIEYEEVSTNSTLKYPHDLKFNNDNDESLTGRWGEELVYNYLLTLRESTDSKVVKAVWVNEERETGLPYDCEIHLYDSDTETTDTIFIEVKTTLSNKRAFFEISAPEVKFAYDKKNSYHLYRVFNAGNQQNVRLTKLENLADKMEKKQVRLCMMI